MPIVVKSLVLRLPGMKPRRANCNLNQWFVCFLGEGEQYAMGGSDRKTEIRHQESGTTECPKCHVRMHKRSVDRHLLTEHGPRVFFWCLRCSHKNNRRDNLRSHYNDCHPDKISDVDKIGGESYEEHGSQRGSHADQSSRKSDRKADRRSPRKDPEDGRPGRSVQSKRELDPSEKERSKPKRQRSEASTPCTVSRPPGEAPLDLSSPKPPPPGQKGRAAVTPRQAVTRGEAAAAPRQVRASIPSIEEQQQVSLEATTGVPEPEGEVEISDFEQPVEGGVKALTEIKLSPTPMIWEDDPIAERPAGRLGGKPLAMMGMLCDELTAGSAPSEASGQPTTSSPPVWPQPMLPDKLLPGQVVRVQETRETYLYAKEGRTICGEVEREFDVVYLKRLPVKKAREAATPQGASYLRRLVRCHQAEVAVAEAPMEKEDLEEAMMGRVTRIQEKSTRRVFKDGQKLTKDKTTRVFDVDFEAAFAAK